jgi:hypothetical protein
VKLTFVANFINILIADFGAGILVPKTREKQCKTLSCKKEVHKILMKLTVG